MDRNIFQGKRIAITAINLEQKEHRGLAVMTKSLIELLNKYGAEVYLITSIASSRLNKINKYIVKKRLKNEIFIADICNGLEKGFNYRERFKEEIPYMMKLILNLIFNSIILYLRNFNLKYHIFNLNQKHRDINIFSPRLAYLKFVKGFIFVNDIFNLSRLRSMRLISNCPKLKISKKDIDLIITDCPLSLRNPDKRSAKILQIIPDAIPIQVSSHPENPVTYYNRLSDAHLSKTLYISQATQSNVKSLLAIENKNKNNEVLYPMPSINIDLLSEAISIPSIRGINKPFILFNSSIVERKRVELTINFFEQSALPNRNCMLLIAGKIHDSDYSKYIKRICEKNNRIVLMNYVSELEKAWLFLNASLLISTASSEGFGIPVLDAATLNLPALASNISSHIEIKNLTKNENLNILDIKYEKIWKNHLNELRFFDSSHDNKFLRIKHFKESLEYLEYESLGKIKKLIST